MEILKEYGLYLKDVFFNLLNNDFYYFMVFVVSFIIASILCGVVAKHILTAMRFKVSAIVYVPLLNIFYITSKTIHSLLAIIMFIQLLVIIPLPHPSHKVWVIGSIIPSNFKMILFMFVVIEFICVLISMIIQYIKFDYELKIVR